MCIIEEVFFGNVLSCHIHIHIAIGNSPTMSNYRNASARHMIEIYALHIENHVVIITIEILEEIYANTYRVFNETFFT